MKKIGILTYHTGFNYGASLQAYALLSVIKKMGYDCEIINFETEQFVASREMFSHKPQRLKEVIKVVSRLPYYNTLIKRQEMFEKYTCNCLDISPLYRTEVEVINHAKDYDCIVCGSDQIWNLSASAGPAANMLFYLNFPKHQKRVAYAASFGKWINEAPLYEKELLPWLKLFDAISVREKSGVEFVKSLNLSCTLTLDPTILLDKEEYERICTERLIKEKYILLFSWSCTKDVIKAAKKVSEDLNLPVYNIVPPPRAISLGIKRKLDVGPKEFLSMIKYADFVVTNSFHGTAFSITFEKPYVSVVDNGHPDPRMKSLLDQLGLSDHLVGLSKLDTNALMDTDYTRVKSKKVELRKESIGFLEKALL